MDLSPQDVLQVVKQHGPIIPNQIKQQLGQGDTTLINVYLSSLKDEGKIKLSNTQLGSSKFAYTPEQKPKLEELIDHLNEKDARTARKLKDEQIIRVQEAEPLVRVGLQNIKDFAIPIKVSTKHGEELFYRYFLTSQEDAQKRIREMLTGATEEPEPPASEPEAAEEPADEPEEEPESEPEPPKPEPKPEPEKPAPKKEAQSSLYEPPEPESELGQTVVAYCEDNDILIDSYDEVRKDSEIDLVLRVPTAVGRITFYAKAKSKKTSNDGDVAAAVLAGKTRMLPAMYLTTGSVTNKAKENPELREITVVELGS